MFATVVACNDPNCTKELLAYQMIIVREVRRCGGGGWRAYDVMFRQLAASSSNIDWSKLNSSSYVVTFLAQSG